MFGRIDHSPRPRNIMYVVVHIYRNQIRPAGLVDQQTDIEVLGVFTTRQDANRYIETQNLIFSQCVIHESVLNPDSNETDSSTFHPEIYS